MRFYSGFLLQNELRFFRRWLKTDDFTLAGFSYGAILAFEEALRRRERIDRLQLFSPAFFPTKPEGFKRLQLKGFRRDPQAYREAFLRSCFAPCPPEAVETKADTEEDLKKLLEYPWPKVDLKTLTDRGIDIEVYLGGRDAVIDAAGAREHFLPYATVFCFKDANHFLQTNQGENE